MFPWIVVQIDDFACIKNSYRVIVISSQDRDRQKCLSLIFWKGRCFMRITFYDARISDNKTMLVKEKAVNYETEKINSPKKVAEMMKKLLHLEEMAEEYKMQNREVVTQKVIPAYNNLADEMEALKGTGKNSQGLCYLENGKEYYTYLVAYTTGSDMSIEEMQKQTEKQRLQDMTDLAEVLKKNPDITQKCTSYHLATEEPARILQDLQVKMQRDFPTPPDTSFTIKSVHPSLEAYTAPAFYLTPPIDDISQNSIYINGSKNYEKMQLYTTLAHEGFPGHLYQNVMERSCGLEPIRSLFGSSGYAEGWATYVEMQSYYYADIDKNLETYLQKNQSALLSLYATTDMGIHYDGWSLADTIDFFADYQITDKEAIKQIYQLIVEEPAHYLKYYIGYLEFLNLRRFAMETYGDEYSNYKFHQALMKMGNAPFSILKEYLPKYWEQ